jgi:hypothetical protein
LLGDVEDVLTVLVFDGALVIHVFLAAWFVVFAGAEVRNVAVVPSVELFHRLF